MSSLNAFGPGFDNWPQDDKDESNMHVLHPALCQLLWFDIRGSFRSLLNVRSNWRQAGLLILVLLFVGFLVSIRSWSSGEAAPGRFGAAMPFWALIYLLMTWLTASADRGLVMRPAEIHFIVGGPFRDRDVITLNLIRLAFRSLISASILSLVALAYVESYLSALVGIWMLIGVSLAVGMVASLSARRAHGGLVRLLRRFLTVAAIGALLLLISQSMREVKESGATPRVSLIASAALETQVGGIILPPLAWLFAPLASDAFFPDTLLLLPSRLAVIAVLVAMIYLLGGRYLESSMRRTEISIGRRQSALRSGVAGGPGAGSWTRRLAVPMFGRWGGAGSVAWMQMVHSIRVLPRFLVFTSTIVGIVLVVPMMVDPVRITGWGVVSWMTGLALYADFLLLLQLPVGFLGPVAQRELLKSLPIPSYQIVFGQLAGPIIPLGVLHGLVTVLFLFLAPDERGLVLLTSLAIIPAAWVLIANINLLGSWGIVRPRALQQRDALAAGRAMASVWIFFLMLSPAIIVSIVCAVIAGALVQSSFAMYLLGASIGAVLSSTIYVWLLARSFRNWQPSSAEGGKEESEHDR